MLNPKKPPSSLTQEEYARVVKSQLIKILRVNPWLSRFYAGYFDLCASNPSAINNLGVRSENSSDPDSKALNPKGPNPMSLNKNIRSCTHIKVNGVPCGSPALHREAFCYFHQRMIRGVATPPKSRLHPIANIENAESIQVSLMEVINALVRNTIDLRRAQLILRALNIAVRNSSRVHFDIYKDEMVREVPDYPAAPEPQKPAEPAISAAVASTPAPAADVKPAKTARVTPPQTTAPAASADPARPKPPARVTAAAAARASTYGRSG